MSFTSVTELMADRTGAHSKAEYPKQYTLKPGDIGVLYLVEETKKEYVIKAVFPSYSVSAGFPNFYRGGPPYDSDPKKFYPEKAYSMWKFKLNDNLVLFDQTGVIKKMKRKNIKLKLDHHCENDGGVHFQPSIEFNIKKKLIRYDKTKTEAYDNIVGFIGVGSVKKLQTTGAGFKLKEKIGIHHPVFQSSVHTRLVGRVSKNTKPIVRLFETKIGDTGCGKDSSQNELGIDDVHGIHHLRCCGP